MMKEYRSHNKLVQILVRCLKWIPLSIVTMILLLLISPLRKLFEHITNPQYFTALFGADLEYMFFCIIASFIYTIAGAIVSTIHTINSRKWWITIGFLYAIYVIIILLGLWSFSEGYFFQYGLFFLDIILGPPLFLGIIEGLYAIKNRNQSVGNNS